MTKKKMTNSARVEFTLSKKDRSQYDDVSFVVAYKNIFLKDKEYYPLSFEKYIIHHKDRDKDNNRTSNLDIVTRDEHEQIHSLELRGKKELCEYKELIHHSEVFGKFEDILRLIKE